MNICGVTDGLFGDMCLCKLVGPRAGQGGVGLGKCGICMINLNV